MTDPFRDPSFRILQQIARDQALYRGVFERTEAFERVRAEQDLSRRIYPHYEAVRRFAELSTGFNSPIWLAKQANELRESMFPGGSRIESALINLMADQVKLDSALRYPGLEALSMTEAITRAYASVAHLESSSLHQSLKLLAPLQETAARSLGLRALIEESLSTRAVNSGLEALVGTLSGLTNASTALWNGLADQPAALLGIPERLQEAPVVQLFDATRGLALLVTEDPEFAELEPATGLLAVEARDLPRRLDAVKGGLGQTYLGALHALEKQGPDYVRHVSTSLRELLDHLIEAVISDEEIARWTTDPKDCQNGRWTRRARLRYLFRHLALSEDYVKVVDGEIDHILQNFFPLNTGTHHLAPDLQFAHLRVQLRRCEYAVIMILESLDAAVLEGSQ